MLIYLSNLLVDSLTELTDTRRR